MSWNHKHVYSFFFLASQMRHVFLCSPGQLVPKHPYDHYSYRNIDCASLVWDLNVYKCITNWVSFYAPTEATILFFWIERWPLKQLINIEGGVFRSLKMTKRGHAWLMHSCCTPLFYLHQFIMGKSNLTASSFVICFYFSYSTSLWPTAFL